MVELPATPFSLIGRIQQHEDEYAWNELLEVYGPVVVGYLRTKGLQDADVRDVAQEVFRAIMHNIEGFDPNPDNGRFRNWLFVIVRSKLADHWRRVIREPQATGDSGVRAILEDFVGPADQCLWEYQYKQGLLTWAADQIRNEFTESTWQAFWLTGVEDRPAKHVAELLGMSLNNVYVYKSRVLARLRAKIRQVEGE